MSLTRKGMGPVPQQQGPAPGATPAPEATRGEPDPARYRLGSRLGKSGQVYEAQSDRYPGRLVVKLMPFATGLPAAAVRAFTHEATRVADLRHPHIVSLMTAGIMADGTPFVAMEPLQGETLEDRMARDRAFSLGDVLPVVRGLASALSAAHAVGVIHREVRADNVFVSDLPGYGLGFARLLDFGVSRLTAAARDAGRIVAPAAWRVLAPEQQQGSLAALGDHGWQELLERADERTDQFALAAMTYRLVTGIEPVAGQEVDSAFERVREERSTRCPAAVDFVLCKALSRRPEQRYDSVALFFRAFEEACLSSRVDDAPTTPAARAPVRDLALPTPDDVDETRPAISGVEALTQPATRASEDAPTVVTWDGAHAARSGSNARKGTPGPVRATPPGTLTQQFFADGDRQEAEWLKGMARRRPAAAASADTTGTARTVPEATAGAGTAELLDLSGAQDELERTYAVPRKRVPLMVVGIGVAVLGFGAVGWALGLWSPGAWLADHTAPAFRAPEAKREAAPVIPPPTPAAPDIAPPAPVAAPAKSAPQPAPAAAPKAATPETAAAPAARTIAPAAPEAANPAPVAGDTPSVRKEPLRGMAWSTTRRRMVRSRPAAVPTESPPPPTLAPEPVMPAVPAVPEQQQWAPPVQQQQWQPPAAEQPWQPPVQQQQWQPPVQQQQWQPPAQQQQWQPPVQQQQWPHR